MLTKLANKTAEEEMNIYLIYDLVTHNVSKLSRPLKQFFPISSILLLCRCLKKSQIVSISEGIVAYVPDMGNMTTHRIMCKTKRVLHWVTQSIHQSIYVQHLEPGNTR